MGQALAELNDAARVGAAGSQAQKDRDVELLGDAERPAGEVLCLLRIRRAEDRDFGHQAIVAVILFVLRRVQARVVGGHDDQAAARADIGGREERVGRHVQAHVFHRGERPRPGNGCAERDFQGYLFIGGPFAVDVFVG